MSEMDFDAFGHPSDRDFLLWWLLPAKHRSDDYSGDLQLLVEQVLQPIVDELLVYVDHWTDIVDPDTAPEGVLDRMLADLGNPFPFDLTVAQKRALAQTLVDLYRTVGTAPGLEAVIRFFVRIEATVIPHMATAWELGVDELGVGTYLGEVGGGLYSFDVQVTQALTDFERDAVTWLAERMKASHEHLIQIVEP